MIEKVTKEMGRAGRYLGFVARDLDLVRMKKIVSALEKGTDIGDTSLPDYISSLNPVTLNFSYNGHDILWHLISAARMDLIQIIMNMNPTPQVNIEHMTMAKEKNINIFEYLKSYYENPLRSEAVKVLTPFFELAKHQLWPSVLLCLYTSSSLIQDHINSHIGGETLLNLACQAGQIEVVRNLITLGADCQVASYVDGKYPLHYAMILTTDTSQDMLEDNSYQLIQLVYEQAKNVINKKDHMIEGGFTIKRVPTDYASEKFMNTLLGKEIIREQKRSEVGGRVI